MLERLKKHDWIITIIVFIFAIFSLLLIFSTTYNASNPQEGEGTIYRQIIFYIIGLGLYFLISIVNIGWLKERNIVLLIYSFVFATLTYVLTFGEVRANTQRWIFLGPLSFQPAEYAKIALIILVAYLYAKDDQKIASEKNSFSKNSLKTTISVAGLGIYAFLIYLQPSLGNAIILTIIWAITSYVAAPISSKSLVTLTVSVLATLSYFQIGLFERIAVTNLGNQYFWRIFTIASVSAVFLALYFLFKYNKFMLIGALAVIISIGPVSEFAWSNVLKDYHRERIETFAQGFNSDPDDSGYQVRQSIIAIGAGRFNGRGFLKGTQSTLKTLPFAHTDFIFAALAEQFGFSGVFILFSLYALLIYRIIHIAMQTSDRFGKIIVCGVIALVVVNLFVNTAMNMGLVPVTGVPLPLISYGGSSVVVILVGLGLVQMVNSSINFRDVSTKFDNSWYNNLR